MDINKQLIESWNSRGYVVRSQENGDSNKFGSTHLITVETSNIRITYETNVLSGVNYFKIISVIDLYKNRTYLSSRYHFKYIALIALINGEVFKSIN